MRLSQPSPAPLTLEQLQLKVSLMNAMGHSLGNEQHHSHTCRFHIRLAAMNLTRERQTIRVPADMDLDYIRFLEDPKQKLMSEGEECIGMDWRRSAR